MKTHPSPTMFSPWIKAGFWVLLVLTLGLGMLAYTTPGMRLNWETIASMCGF